MELSLKELTDQALSLPASSRAILSERLVASLVDISESELQKVWAAEAILRRDQIRSGAVQSIDGNDVLTEVRRVVGR